MKEFKVSCVEVLTDLVEHGVILTKAQGGFSQDKSTILETCNVPDVDLLKSLYEHTTVPMPQTVMDSVNLKA
jgi:hypothetical protein